MEQQEVSASSSLKTLHPFWVRKVFSEWVEILQHSTLPYQTMNQMILPSNHHFTKLVVSAEHIRIHHAGPQLLITSLRERYWIPRTRNLVATVIHQCLICYRFKAKQHNSSWASYHQHEYNLRGHSSLQAWTMLDQYHSDWVHHVAKP